MDNWDVFKFQIHMISNAQKAWEVASERQENWNVPVDGAGETVRRRHEKDLVTWQKTDTFRGGVRRESLSDYSRKAIDSLHN